GDGNVLVPGDRPRHAGGPQQLAAEMAVDELVQVEEVLQQLPSGGERRRDQLDQRLGIVGRDVLTGERGAERAWVRRRSEASLRRDAQGLLLQALAAALEDLRLAAVDERGQAPLEGDIEAGAAHGL